MELIEKIEAEFAEFLLAAKKLNASQSRKARKSSLRLGLLFKEYRKESMGN